MTKIYFLLFLVLGSGVLRAQATLTVKVTNIKSEVGSIMVGLFADEDKFLKKPTLGKVVKVTGNQVEVVFDNLKPGVYGLSVIHDENDNRVLDKNMAGIPKEGFAFGNNSMGTFGPPSFSKAKVVIQDKPEVQEIKLRHM